MVLLRPKEVCSYLYHLLAESLVYLPELGLCDIGVHLLIDVQRVHLQVCRVVTRLLD